jgi:c-di-GMP-binding flagellar brake protein YcgR
MIQTESRLHPRLKCRVIIETIGSTIDLSEGGACVLVAKPLPEGAEVQLAFQLPESEETARGHGRVVRVAQSSIDKELFEVGLQFLRLETGDREAIARYVQTRADARSWN